MSELTHLGIARLRDAFRDGDFSAREIADATEALPAPIPIEA